MAPLSRDTIVLQESKMIKDRLLKVQNEIEQIIRQTEKKLLDSALHDLGYDDNLTSFGSSLIDTRVISKEAIIAPKLISKILPISKRSAATTQQTRKSIESILKHQSKKMIVIVGPCAIHDPKAALEYANYVKKWRDLFGQHLEIIMRTYVEKPRTELGWKGFVYDPLLDSSNDINLGLIATRMLACLITDLGVPIAVERLNALTPQYLNSLVAYDVIGARNTTDQKAREYASATSSPIGFKNTPEGSIEAAAQAIVAAKGSHSFLGIDIHGSTKQINSSGNTSGHIILRGANSGPNYEKEYILATRSLLERKNLMVSIVVDASHGNSLKQAKNQIKVIQSICEQITAGETALKGVMIESNLVAGNQKLVNPIKLVYGQSIVDDCVDILETETMLRRLSIAVSKNNTTKTKRLQKV